MSERIIPKDYKVYVKPSEIEISTRKLESYKKFCEILNWGRRNPLQFAKDFFGIELLDAQAWFLMNAWTTPFVLLNATRAMGKTTLDAVFVMLKMTLFNNYEAVICSGTSNQSFESFQKMEQIAKKQLSSFTGLTDFFIGNVVSNTNTDGFIHNPMAYKCELYNGSRLRTANSSTNTQRGRRANLLILDEVGFMSEETIKTYTAFTTNDSNFKLGGGVNLDAAPREIPNQVLFTSSASAVGTPFWMRYREFAKRMFLGDDRYFCAHINADVVINATFHGKKYPVPLLTQEKIDSEMRMSRPTALREYYGIFLTEGSADQIIKREWIARNSEMYVPELYNVDNESEYVFTYDPARSNDNSFILIGKWVYDENKGWKIKLVNGVNFADLGTRRRTPMRIPEQIKEIRKLWLSYNGKNLEYDKIEMVIDGGSGGGGGGSVADMLMETWFEDGRSGRTKFEHPGMIDKEYSKEYLSRFPNAVKNLTITIPNQMKSVMYESLIQCVENDLIIFPERYDHHGFLNLTDIDEELIEKTRKQLIKEGMTDAQIEFELENLDSEKVRMYKLSLEEEVALSQLDMMKEEIVNICRFKTDTGKDRFNLPAHKSSEIEQSEATMNDDRAYTLAMMGWALTRRRNLDRLNALSKKKDKDYIAKLPIKAAQRFSIFG